MDKTRTILSLLLLRTTQLVCTYSICNSDADCRNAGEKCLMMAPYGCAGGLCACPEGTKRFGDICSSNDACANDRLTCKNGRCRCKSFLKEVNGGCVLRELGEPCRRHSDCHPNSSDLPEEMRSMEAIYYPVRCTHGRCQCTSGYSPVTVREVTADWMDERISQRSADYCFSTRVNITENLGLGSLCHFAPPMTAQFIQSISICGPGSACVRCPEKVRHFHDNELPMFQIRYLRQINGICAEDCRRKGPTTSFCCKNELAKMVRAQKEFAIKGYMGNCMRVFYSTLKITASEYQERTTTTMLKTTNGKTNFMVIQTSPQLFDIAHANSRQSAIVTVTMSLILQTTVVS